MVSFELKSHHYSKIGSPFAEIRIIRGKDHFPQSPANRRESGNCTATDCTTHRRTAAPVTLRHPSNSSIRIESIVAQESGPAIFCCPDNRRTRRSDYRPSHKQSDLLTVRLHWRPGCCEAKLSPSQKKGLSRPSKPTEPREKLRMRPSVARLKL